MKDMSELASLIDDQLRPRLNPYGYQHAEVNAGQDHDGEEAIFVVAHYGPGAPPLDAAASLDALVAVNHAVGERDDGRFVHLVHRWADEAVEDDPPRRRATAR